MKDRLDISKEMFIQGVCLGYHPDQIDEGIRIATRAWEATYKERAKKLTEK